MTNLAKDMGLTTVVRPETAPQFFVFPSIIQASISIVPLLVRTDPLPALKFGWFSSSRTYKIITQQQLSNCLHPLNMNKVQPKSIKNVIF